MDKKESLKILDKYTHAFAKLEPCIIDSKEDFILIRGLTVKELERLLED